MTRLPAFPISLEELNRIEKPLKSRLTIYGPLPESEEDTFAVEMMDNGIYLYESSPGCGGGPKVWVTNWSGEKTFFRSAWDEPKADDDMFAPYGEDEILCEDNDPRASTWMREVTREEFDRAVAAEALRQKMSPPVFALSDPDLERLMGLMEEPETTS